MKEYEVNDYVVLNFGNKLIVKVTGVYSQIGKVSTGYSQNVIYEVQFQAGDHFVVYPNEIECKVTDEGVFEYLMESEI